MNYMNPALDSTRNLIKEMAQSIVARYIQLMLGIYPILLLTVRGAMNGIFIVLAVISIYIIITQRKVMRTGLDDDGLSIVIALSSAVLAVLFSQICHWNVLLRYFDSPSRLLFAIPIFIVLRDFEPKTVGILQYGFPFGAISALAIALFMQDFRIDPFASRAANAFLNPIHFGDMSLLMGLLSIFTLNWMGRDSRLVIVLKVSGLISGIIASSLSGTRSGWVAMLVVLIAWAIIIKESWAGSFKRVTILGAVIMIMTMVYFITDEAQQRINDTYQEIQLISKGELNSSIGLRLQVWKAAIKMFIENPIVGVGSEGFTPRIVELAQDGFVTKAAAEIGRAEVHNHILGNMARYGILGLVSALSIYLVPLLIFIKTAKQVSSYGRGAAMMGICLVLAYIVFGMTVEMFNLKMIAAFYGMTVAILLAAATSNMANQE